jgi:hypothetical protein
MLMITLADFFRWGSQNGRDVQSAIQVEIE